jgi:DNA-binding transcriptional MerR regulator
LTLQPGSTFTLADMTSLRVSDLAARAGVPPSTVRFYERAGLLPAARRAANGYRMFDESALYDLALIGRVKDAGMRLDDIPDVVAAWHGGSCRALEDRLRSHLTAELDRVRGQIADLAAYRRDLETMLNRLSARTAGDAEDTERVEREAPGPHPDRCGPGCGCDTVLAANAPDSRHRGSAGDHDSGRDRGLGGNPDPLPACSLGRDELAARLDQWRALAADGNAERDDDTVRLTLAPAMLADVAALVAAEADCCPQARFTLEVTAGHASLLAEIPGIGTELDAQRS